ncbi:MAG: DEAD/DEAH box helicase [Actinomycetota bacterium]|nr:DEAD/DEAH box helicase [Actinomycetota bacterium]
MSPSFADLGVPSRICAALEARGITEPFAIQAATIADALDGQDVCGRAPTGSGKTLAFGVPLIATVERAEKKRPRALILAPTRELADQINTELRSFAGDVRVGVVYGGVGYGKQFDLLRRGVDVLVACPGRLEDLIQQGEVDLRAVEQVVLDEADRMADMGFLPAVRRILDQTAEHRQTVLFSATLDGDVAKLTRDYQHDPVTHMVGEDTPDITAAHHRFWTSEKADRSALTARIVENVWPAIVFTRTRHGADRLSKQLNRAGVDAAPIHGGRSQNQRTRALASFADGTVQALIATDVAARGIHVDGVACVLHYDPPEDHKTYIHRSGRTARAGQTGVVVSLVQPDQVKDVRTIQRHLEIGEPITEAEPHTLRSLSERPAETRVRPASDGTAARPSSGATKRRRKPGQGNDQQRNGNGQQRNGGGQGKNGSRNGSPKGGGSRNGGRGKGGGGQQSRNGSGGQGKTNSGAKSGSRSGQTRSGSGSNRGSGGGNARRRTRSGAPRR